LQGRESGSLPQKENKPHLQGIEEREREAMISDERRAQLKPSDGKGKGKGSRVWWWYPILLWRGREDNPKCSSSSKKKKGRSGRVRS